MTIEFNCPYCTALIRVPDHAGGGKGRCPKCATRLKVPKTSTPRPVDVPHAAELPRAVEAPVAPAVEDEPILLEEETDGRPREIENFFDADYDPRKANRPAPAPVEEPAVPSFPTLAQPVRSSLPAPSSSRFTQKKRSGAGGWLLGLGLLIAAGVGGWYVWQQTLGEQLGGELIAETADSLELAPSLIEKSSLKESADNVATILKNLEKTPVPLISTLMQVQLRGSSKGIHVHLSAGTQTRFYRVAIRGNEALQKFHTKHAAELEIQRVRNIDKAAAEFAVEYLRVIDKRADQVTVTGFRNSLAIPSLTRGLGHQIVATYGRTIYPCVYEDREGALYFLLPPEVKEFELSGRKDAAGGTYFPATYKVVVAGPMDVPEKTGDEPDTSAKDKKSKETDESESMSEDEPKPKMDSEDEDSDSKPKPKSKKKKKSMDDE